MKRALERNLRAAFARAYVRVIGGNRRLYEVVFDSVLPILNLSAYVYVYRFMKAPAELASFVIIGGVILTFWFNVLWNMGSQLYWEKEIGNLEAYLVAPVSRMAVLLGMALGGLFNTSIRATATLLAGVFLFQIPFNMASPLAAAAVFMLTLVDLYALGMMFASLFLLFGREAWHSVSLFQEPIFFISGIYFPVKFFPFWLQVAASLIPLTLGLDATRKLVIQGATFSDVQFHFVFLLVCAVTLLYLAKRCLDFMENLGKREGRLTLRWT